MGDNLPGKGVGSHENKRRRKQVILLRGGGEVNAGITRPMIEPGGCVAQKRELCSHESTILFWLQNTICLEHW